MQVVCRFGSYEDWTADLSGAELEVLSRVMGKMRRADDEQVEFVEYLIVKHDEPIKFTAKVVTSRLASRDEVEHARVTVKTERIASAVEILRGKADLWDTFTPEREEAVKNFLSQMYYQDVIDSKEHKSATVAQIEDDGVVIGVDGLIFKVKNDGTYAR
jgi:hypothetical protein